MQGRRRLAEQEGGRQHLLGEGWTPSDTVTPQIDTNKQNLKVPENHHVSQVSVMSALPHPSLWTECSESPSIQPTNLLVPFMSSLHAVGICH